MKNVKEVTVFTNGNSSKISTWSNVPYFFTETLIAKGIKVNRVDIGPSKLLQKIYNTGLSLFNKVTGGDSTYTYFRSRLHNLDAQRKIKHALKQYPNADANISLTFSFSAAGLTPTPTVLFGDWTYDYYFKYFLNRRPNALESDCIQREDDHIESADLVLPLFPSVTDYMRDRYQNPNICYLGNVVNSLIQVTKSEILAQKASSQSLLFIGSKKYREGAESLIQAYSHLKSDFPDLAVHIVGMDAQDFDHLPDGLPDGVTCYGYLDKADEQSRRLYYSLLMEARAIVNTTPKWGAFSATLEAMYFCNPVITTPYEEFLETFGTDIKFGHYCDAGSIDQLCSKIRSVLATDTYESLCINANESVKHHTWDAYIDRVLDHINGLAPKRDPHPSQSTVDLHALQLLSSV